MAEPEFKMDPRDGQYKLLEINARTTMQSALPATCGVNIEYAAYLDTIGQHAGDSISPQDGILWVDEFNDLQSCLIQVKKGKLGIREIASSFKGKKVYARAVWDDPIPFFISLLDFGSGGLRGLFRRINRYISFHFK